MSGRECLAAARLPSSPVNTDRDLPFSPSPSQHGQNRQSNLPRGDLAILTSLGLNVDLESTYHALQKRINGSPLLGEEMPKLFISYNHKDRNLAKALSDRLKAAGYEVWWDDHLPTGQYFMPEIDRALSAADAVIVLWTSNSVRSKWVYFEALMASELKKLIPFQVGRCQLPLGLHELNSLSYDPSWTDDREEWSRSLQKIDEAIALGRAYGGAKRPLDLLTWEKISEGRDPADFRDYLRRYPDSVYAPDARRLLGGAERRRLVRRAWSWALGVTLYAILCLPLISLQFDYDSRRALFWATLYFPFFCFLPVFGTMMVPIYLVSSDRALRFGFTRSFGLPPLRRLAPVTCIFLLLIVPALLCLVVTYAEVSDGYGPWQLTQAVLDVPVARHAAQVGGLQTVKGSMDVRGDTRSLSAIFESIRDTDLISLFETMRNPSSAQHCLAKPMPETPSTIEQERTGSALECLIHMNNLQKVIEITILDSSARSWTNYAYRFSFFFLR